MLPYDIEVLLNVILGRHGKPNKQEVSPSKYTRISFPILTMERHHLCERDSLRLHLAPL